MCRKLVLAAGLLFAVSAVSQTTQHFDGKTWWNSVKVLAADNMEGRETGSKGLEAAEAYVVTQLRQAGLQPAGKDGYYQPVNLQSRQIIEKDSSLALIRDEKVEPLTLGEDAFFSTRVDLAAEVRAPLVFVGYGLTVPEQYYDDLAALDLKRKIAVIVTGSPSEIAGALAAHSSSAAERWKAFRKAGAIGIIGIPNPAAMDIPWSRMSVNRTHVSMTLADPNFDDTPGERLSVIFNPAHAEELFTGSGHTLRRSPPLQKTASNFHDSHLRFQSRRRLDLPRKPCDPRISSPSYRAVTQH